MERQFSQRVLNLGFVVALVLAAVAFLMAGWYLLGFANSSHNAVVETMAIAKAGDALSDRQIELLQNSLGIHTYVARVLLVSCGMFIALSFGFLGFALFLVGAAGQSDLTASQGSQFSLTLTNLAPGTIAIVAAAVLAGVCVTRPLPFEATLGGEGSGLPVEGQAGPDHAADDPLGQPDRGPPPDSQ